MIELVISPKDLKDLEVLAKQTETIYEIYNELSKLEYLNKKNTEEYTNLISRLKEEIKKENNIYDNLNLDFNKRLRLISIINLKYIDSSFNKNKEYLINQKHENISYRRIFNHLNNLNLYDKDGLNSFIPDSYLYSNGTINIDDDENEIKKGLLFEKIIYNGIERDFFISFLFFLEEYIKQSNLKESLINIKNNTVFENKVIEEEIISNNFNMQKPILCYEFILNGIKIEYDYLRDLTEYLAYNLAENQIMELLSYEDSDYKENEKMIESYIRCTLFKASLQLLSADAIDSLMYMYEEIVENDYYKNRFPNDEISQNIVEEIFNNVNEDNKKMFVMRLKKN